MQLVGADTTRRAGAHLATLLQGGDAVALIGQDPNRVAVPDITRLYVSKRYSPAEVETLRRATRVQALPQNWRSYFLGRQEKLG